MRKLQGFGVGFRPPHYAEITSSVPREIDWFEVISENFMATGGRPRHFLAKLKEHYPVVLHGVGLSIAGTDLLDRQYLKALKNLADWVNPPLITDHLCWTSSQGRHSHDLLPFPYHEASLRHITTRIEEVQDYLGRRILLENPSAYIAFHNSTIGEAEFLQELCRRTGCGILLDLNNLYVNSQNLGLDPLQYLATLSPEHVGQFHVAGHTVYPDIRIDTHDHHVPEEVWHLYRLAVLKFPHVPTLLEWDDKIPEVAVLLQEVSRARREAEAAQANRLNLGTSMQWDSGTAAPRACETTAEPLDLDLSALQSQFFDAIAHRSEPESHFVHGITHNQTPVHSQRGFSVYHQGFFLRARDAMKDFFPTMAFILEDAGMEALVADYLEHFPSTHYSINYIGRNFEAYLRQHKLPADFGVEAAVLADLAAFEWTRMEVMMAPDGPSPVGIGCLAELGEEQWAQLRIIFTPQAIVLDLDYDIASVWHTVERGEIPPIPEETVQTILFYRDDLDVAHEVIPEREGMAFRLAQEGRPLWDVCQAMAARREVDQVLLQEVMAYLQHWFAAGIVMEITLDPP